MPNRRPSRLASALVLALLIVGSWAVPARAQKRAPGGTKVLLLSGGQRHHHGYRDQAFYLSNLLEDTGRYETTIVEDAAILESPALGKYDVLVVLADRRDHEFHLSTPQQQALLDAVEGGLGYVSIHGADNSAPDWVPAWREMLGGVFSHVGLPDSKTRKGTYRVEIAESDHPIVKGLDDFDLNDELYYQIQMQPGVQPLATVELEGQDWPVAWTRTYGEGRVFHTPLGHRDFGPDKDDPLRNPGMARLLMQGIIWVADGSRHSAPSPTPPEQEQAARAAARAKAAAEKAAKAKAKDQDE